MFRNSETTDNLEEEWARHVRINGDDSRGTGIHSHVKRAEVVAGYLANATDAVGELAIRAEHARACKQVGGKDQVADAAFLSQHDWGSMDEQCVVYA